MAKPTSQPSPPRQRLPLLPAMVRRARPDDANRFDSAFLLLHSAKRFAWRMQPFGSPHPGPLPRGEGTASNALWKANVCGMFSDQRTVHPLPNGEGRGEGKQCEKPSHVLDPSRTSQMNIPDHRKAIDRLDARIIKL